jgi:acyl dehydratase
MPLDRERLLSATFPEPVHLYTEKDAMLYALGIGLGSDPLDEGQLRFVYEKNLVAFPTLAVVLALPGPIFAAPQFGVTMPMVVHGETALTLHKPLMPKGKVRSRSKVNEVIDKGEGRGALLYTERSILDDTTGELIASIKSTAFARADGGFGGPSGPLREPHALPDAPPDQVVEMPSLPQAALIYRLSGDYNPLHADPEFAKKVKFPRPIFHGLGTYGIAAHAVLKTYCNYEARRMKAFDARFSAPVFPGETITVEMWKRDNAVYFRAFVKARDAKVLDNGRALLNG